MPPFAASARARSHSASVAPVARRQPEVAEGERGAEPDAARAAGDEHAAAGEEAGREAINDAGHRSGLEGDGGSFIGAILPSSSS